MNLKEKLAQIKAKLEAFKAIEKPTLDQVNEAKELATEYKNVAGQIEALEAIESLVDFENKSHRKADPVTPANTQKQTNGFESFSDFLGAVKNQSVGKQDPRFANTMYEKNGEDGGFLVPEQMITDVQKVLTEQESLLSRARIFRVSGNNLTLPLDESTPWSNGVKAYWIEEGGLYSESKPKFAQVSFRLHKLGVLVKITDELLEDGTALESFIRNSAPEAILHQVNKAMIDGDGVGKPQGILVSPFTVTVAKEVAQTADTIVARNIINMYSHMLPSSRARAVWLCHASVEPALRTIKDDNGNFIFLSPGSQLNQSPYGQLMGRPVIPMMDALKPIGDVGDIVFADFTYYWAIVKTAGMKQSISTHLYFDRDITAYKFTLRLDGKVPFQKPVETEVGGFKMSAFVVLEAR